MNKKDLNFLIFIGLIIVIWFKFLSPSIVNTASHNHKEGFESVLSISDQFKVSKSICSKSFCVNQWQVSFDKKND